MVIFHSFLYVYQRVYPPNLMPCRSGSHWHGHGALAVQDGAWLLPRTFQAAPDVARGGDNFWWRHWAPAGESDGMKNLWGCYGDSTWLQDEGCNIVSWNKLVLDCEDQFLGYKQLAQSQCACMCIYIYMYIVIYICICSYIYIHTCNMCIYIYTY